MTKFVSIWVFAICIVTSFGQFKLDSAEILRFANALEKGEKYAGKFVHPFTGDTMERKIEGVVNNRCIYTEQMPNGGRQICRFKVKDLKRLAQYYRSTALAKSMSTSIHMELGVDSLSKPSSITEVRNEIDSVEVGNPVQECLENGDCIIEGYGELEASATITLPVNGSVSMNDLAFACKKEKDDYFITVELVNHSCKPMTFKNPEKAIYKCKNAEYEISLDLKNATEFNASVDVVYKK